MTRNKIAKRLLALLCCLAMTLTMVPAAVYADGEAAGGGEVAIVASNFLDENFREFVKTFDTSSPKDDELSDVELAAVTTMDAHGQGITNLTGIEKFTSLDTLNVSLNPLTSLPNLDGLTSLTTLTCNECGLTSLPKLPNSLTTLNAANNGFTILYNISSLPNLTELDVSQCKSLTVLSVQSYDSLTILTCTSSPIKVLVCPNGFQLAFPYEPAWGTVDIDYKFETEKVSVTLSPSPNEGYATVVGGSILPERGIIQVETGSSSKKVLRNIDFTPFINGIQPGQTVTQGTPLTFEAPVLGGTNLIGEKRDVPVSWRVQGYDGNTSFDGSFPVQGPYRATVDTTSLPPGEYTLSIQYKTQTYEDGKWNDPVAALGDGADGPGDVEVAGRSISFTVKEPEYTGPSYYYLTVENGTGDGSYTYGSKPVIEADAPAEGKVFDKWVLTKGEGTIGNAAESKTTFTMGFGSATVTATYKDEEKPVPQQYQLTVKNGTGSGTYAAGTEVAIKGDKAAAGKVFDRWVLAEGKGTIADADSRETTFTMAESDAVVKAVYKKAGADPADKPGKPDQNGGADGSKDSDGNQNAPKTGDDQMLFGWLAVLSAALAGLYVIRRKETLDE